jgi:hypothetical protein
VYVGLRTVIEFLVKSLESDEKILESFYLIYKTYQLCRKCSRKILKRKGRRCSGTLLVKKYCHIFGKLIKFIIKKTKTGGEPTPKKSELVNST